MAMLYKRKGQQISPREPIRGRCCTATALRWQWGNLYPRLPPLSRSGRKKQGFRRPRSRLPKSLTHIPPSENQDPMRQPDEKQAREQAQILHTYTHVHLHHPRREFDDIEVSGQGLEGLPCFRILMLREQTIVCVAES